jgi:hypothetical protein
MAVLILTKVKGQTQEGYDHVKKAVEPSIKKSPGFILHYAYPAEDGWLITELWHSKKEADDWFGLNVVPNLPAGIHPKRTYQDIQSVILPEGLKLV